MSTSMNGSAYDEYQLDSPILVLNGHSHTWFPKSNTRKRFLTAFYFMAAYILFGYFVVYYISQYGSHPIFWDNVPISYGWQFVYFSHWVGILQMIFFQFAGIDLLLSAKDFSPRLHKHKDRFYDVMFSLTLVSFTFYCAFVVPNRISNLNVSMTIIYEDIFTHLIPMVFLICESFVSVHRYASVPCHFFRDSLIPATIVIAFAGWSAICNNHNGRYAYQFIAEADATQRTLVAIGMVLLSLIYFVLGRSIARCFWADQPLSAEHLDDPFGSYASFVAYESFSHDGTHPGTKYNAGDFAAGLEQGHTRIPAQRSSARPF